MLTLVTPAADRKLLSVEDIRAVAGLAPDDVSRDTDLNKLALRVSDRIAQECAVAPAGIAAPTLKQETLEQTFRLSCAVPALVLARRFVGEVVGVTEDGAAVDGSGYELDAGAGMLRRLDGGRRSCWRAAVVVVTYKAGFATVPEDLALAATIALQEQLSAAGRDPLLKRDRVEDLCEQEFWVGGLGGVSGGAPSTFSSTVQAMLDPYRTTWLT